MFTLSFLNNNMARLIFLVFIIFSVSCSFVMAAGELESINTKSKDRYISPDALDRLMIQLRQFNSAPGKNQLDDSLLLDTYRTISNSYFLNNHFKQAYEVINKYILYKETLLLKSNAVAIKNTQDLFKFRDQKDSDKEKLLQDSLVQMTKDKIALSVSINSFKRNFSFLLIVLSSIFAILLVAAGIRLLNLRSKTIHNKDRIKKIHRRANIGLLQTGLLGYIQNSFYSLKNQTIEFCSLFRSTENKVADNKDIKQVVSKIEKIFD